MFDVPGYVRLSEWVTVLVVIAASAAAAVRFASVYSHDVYPGVVALLLAADALFVWALLRKNSLRRQRALVPERISDGQKSKR